MRDFWLYASGTLGPVVAFIHGWLGETRVFACVQVKRNVCGG
jgi:pimeloyl-ACP methyl ester carboxylesterase